MAYLAGGGEKPKMSRSTLMLLGLVVVGGVVLFLMYGRKGASTASNGPESADETVQRFLVSGEEHVTLMRAMLKDTDKVVQRFRAYPTRTQIPLDRLHKNPFRLAPPPVQAEAPVNESAIAAQRRLDQEKQEATDSVRRLQLQSIMRGTKGQSCMINNKLYTVGQVVDGFTIEEIRPDSVVVRKKGFGFKLSMKGQGR